MLIGRPIKDFLYSIGFQFTESSLSIKMPEGYDIEQLINSRHHRIGCRDAVGYDNYGGVFEHVVCQLLMKCFRFDILQGVKIEDEGQGGDYDILAFQSPYLHYIECKTGRDIKFQEIFIRHGFLRPALTLILIDRPKKDLSDIVYNEVQPVLTKEAKKKDVNLAGNENFKFPINLISGSEEGLALYHTYRNIFIASGENLDKVIRKTLRYFHQEVLQSSYLS